VYECVIAGLFLSHGIRKNIVFHAILNGPPTPPLHIEINGEQLYDVRTDVDTWLHILKKVISGKSHPGITTGKTSFEALLKAKAEKAHVYVLEEDGKPVDQIESPENALFVLGDHVGLPKKAEDFVLRYGEKISLGRQPYLAASCITILNYLLDKRLKFYS
jgi:tRNA (pseudouridine54-N1)-methyltransferase